MHFCSVRARPQSVDGRKNMFSGKKHGLSVVTATAGYSDLTGGYEGGQAEYARVPFGAQDLCLALEFQLSGCAICVYEHMHGGRCTLRAHVCMLL